MTNGEDERARWAKERTKQLVLERTLLETDIRDGPDERGRERDGREDGEHR